MRASARVASRSVTPLGQRPKRNTQRLGTLSKGVSDEHYHRSQNVTCNSASPLRLARRKFARCTSPASGGGKHNINVGFPDPRARKERGRLCLSFPPDRKS